jgi:hypothetical protein
LRLEVVALAREPVGQALHDLGHKAVGLLNAALGLVDEADLYVLPAALELARVILGQEGRLSAPARGCAATVAVLGRNAAATVALLGRDPTATRGAATLGVLGRRGAALSLRPGAALRTGSVLIVAAAPLWLSAALSAVRILTAPLATACERSALTLGAGLFSRGGR